MAVSEAEPEGFELIVGEIVRERYRQIEVEGYDAEHDATNDRGELADAAACYVWNVAHPQPPGIAPFGWPWADGWKPTTPRRDLIKAAALILAEIERLDRDSRNLR